MKKKLQVANIGMKFGMCHVEGALNCEYAEIAIICDSNEENLRFAGERYNIPEEKWVTDYMDIVNNKDIDVVTVAIPDQQHKKVSCDLLRAGKHVLCEKPLALTREDIEEIVKVAEESDAKFMVGQICRFTPAFEKAKELIEAGTLGELYFVESEYAHDYMLIQEPWRCDPLRHSVIGGGCHAVDLLRWLAGDPEEVFAYGTHRLLPHVTYDDATVAVMKFNENLMGKVFVSTGCKRDYTMRTVIYGTKGTLICDNTSPTMTLFTVDEKQVTKEPETIEIEVNNHNAVKEFEVFADAILNNKKVLTDAEEGAKTVAVCLAIVESAKTGEKVKPNYEF